MKEDKFEFDQSDEERISLEASAWIAKLDEGFSGEDQDGFLDWLAQDPKHREVYNERLAFWNDMSQLEDWRPEHSLEPNPDLLASRPAPKLAYWFKALGGIAAILALGFFLVNEGTIRDRSESRVLAFGGAESYENYVLEDGSVVELNQGAEASVLYSAEKRLIFLHKGEAHFMVAKELDRPFLVRAGDAVVQATGTAFNVALGVNGVEVLVTEGRVLVDASTNGSSGEALNEGTVSVRELVAGQRSVLSVQAELTVPEVISISTEEIDQRLLWKGEVLDFTNVPLHEVAEEFNRRNRTKIVIGEPELRDLEITAKLRSDNLDGFVALLDVAMNVDSNRDGAFEIVLRSGDRL
jgi:transmembrane sensor